MNFNSALDKIFEEYFEEFLYRFSVKATKLGIHRYDYKFGSFDKMDFDSWTAELKSIKKKLFLSKIKVKKGRKLDYLLLEKRVDSELNWVANEKEYEINPLMYTSTIKDGLLYSAFGSHAPFNVRSKNFLDRLSAIKSMRKGIEENLQFSNYLEKAAALKELQFLNTFVDEFSGYLLGKSNGDSKDDFKTAKVEALGEIGKMLNFIDNITLFPENRSLSFVKELKREYMGNSPLSEVRVNLKNRLSTLHERIGKKARSIKISQSCSDTIKDVLDKKKLFTIEQVSAIFDHIKSTGESIFGQTDLSVEFKLILQSENRVFDFVKGISPGIIIPVGPFDTHTVIPLIFTSQMTLPALVLKLVSLGYPGKSYESEIKRRKKSQFRAFFVNPFFNAGWEIYVKQVMSSRLKNEYGDEFELAFLYDQYSILLKAFIENELFNNRIGVEEFKKIIEEDRIILNKDGFINSIITENGKSLKGVIGLNFIMAIKEKVLRNKMNEKEFHIQLLSHSSLPFRFIEQRIRV
ncbi:MAG: hypothetical protein U9Q18_05315 [Caldisericota bacterium]|nr:hypothetical protein [Caldisericota bacterium]